MTKICGRWNTFVWIVLIVNGIWQLQDLIEEWKQSEVELTQFYDFKSQTIPTVNDLKQVCMIYMILN